MASLAPIVMRRELRLSAPPERLWPLVSNTERFNRSLGLPAMTVEGVDPASFAKKVRASLFGLTLKWRELPFEWVEGRFFRSIREFESGPIARFEGGMELRREPDGSTRVLVDSAFTPRNAVGTLLVKHAAGKKAMEDAAAMLERFDKSLACGEECYPAKRTKSPVNAPALAQRAEVLRQAACDKAIAARLLRFVEHGYDDELSRMRPFELADAWGFQRLAALKVFLHATRAGLLDLSWEVLCPNCSGANHKAATLGGLDNKAQCPGCELEYGVDLDRSVELRFSASPVVRATEAHTFCVGSPARTPFAAMQLVSRPGEARTVELDLPAESFVLRDLENKRCLALRPSASCPAGLNVDLAAMEGEAPFKPGAVRLTLSPGAKPTVVRLERESWKEKAATAALVTTLQNFRDLFSSEVLAPGVEISVRTVALLFTDLKGSTALYEKVGDAAAYSIVRDHFGYLFDIVEERGGAVVKTIGDAVMAVFARPEDAVAAALEMQERVGELNARLAPKPAVVLKIGVHAGPSIAINAGGVLDYFGTTVNIAARVQNESLGEDVVLSQSVFAEKSVSSLLSSRRFQDQPFEANLKGLSAHFQLHRIQPRG